MICEGSASLLLTPLFAKIPMISTDKFGKVEALPRLPLSSVRLTVPE